jgi:hypothetical protein
MKWETAIWTLNNRDEAEEQNPDATLDAIRAMIDLIEEYCETDTDGLGDWLQSGEWDTNSATIPGPADIAQEWDDLSAAASQ